MAADERFAGALRALASALVGRASNLDAVVAAFARHDIVPRIDDALRFARERQVLFLRHEPSGVTIEVSFGWLPFEEEALARARGTLI